jgi:hypothetical protein
VTDGAITALLIIMGVFVLVYAYDVIVSHRKDQDQTHRLREWSEWQEKNR